MKKGNILIAVFTILAAASAAKAQETDFDGAKGFKPQSMHEIFAESHQFVPPAASAALAVEGEDAPILMGEPWNAGSPDVCAKVELAPGLVIPVCLSGEALTLSGARPGLARVAADETGSFFRNYRKEQPANAAGFAAAAGGKGVKLMYTGKRIFLAAEQAAGGHPSNKIGLGTVITIIGEGAAAIEAVYQAGCNVIPSAVENYYSHQYNNPNENNNGGSGSTYHSGQDGNSDYDVNKALKGV